MSRCSALGGLHHDVRATVGRAARVAVEHLAQFLAGAGDGLVVGGDASLLHGCCADQQSQRLLQGQPRRLLQATKRFGADARVRPAAFNPERQVLAGIPSGTPT